MKTPRIAPDRPLHFARALNLDKSLGWKLCRIATADSPGEIAPYVPGELGVRIAQKAFGDAGTPRQTIDEFGGAASDFDRFVEEHAGDRQTLSTMLAELGAEGRAEKAEADRRQAFLGNSAIWGVRAQSRLTTHILAPNADEPSYMDLVNLVQLREFCRLRRTASWPIFRKLTFDDLGREMTDPWAPVDPEGLGADGVPWIRAFSTSPLPRVERVQIGPETRYELCPGAIGKRAAVTCVLGMVTRRFLPVYRTEIDRVLEVTNPQFTPVEQCVCDVLVHRELPVPAPLPILFGAMAPGGNMSLPARERDRLSVDDAVRELGEGLAVIATHDAPHYVDLLHYTLETLRWKPEDFRAYRLAIRYPPIPAVAALRFELPERRD